MITRPATSVAIIVDPRYEDELHILSEQIPVWIVDTPPNRALAEEVWKRSPNLVRSAGVTTFKVDLTETPAQWCAGILPTVDLHHGEPFHHPPYEIVDVIERS
jgi:hypothetical protein